MKEEEYRVPEGSKNVTPKAMQEITEKFFKCSICWRVQVLAFMLNQSIVHLEEKSDYLIACFSFDFLLQVPVREPAVICKNFFLYVLCYV